MQLGETSRKYAIAAVVVVAVALALAIFLRSSNTPDVAGPKKAFFSVNDGKTWFVDDITKYPPFQHEGKTAVRARVFTTDGGKTSFCGYLERYTPEAKSKLEEADKQGVKRPGTRPPVDLELIFQGIEAKAPGGSGWVNRSAGPAYAAVVIVRGKGPGQNPEEVLP